MNATDNVSTQIENDQAILAAAHAAVAAKRARQAQPAAAVASRFEPTALPAPRDYLFPILKERLACFAPVKQQVSWGKPESEQGLYRIEAALDVLDAAIARLGKRKGEREDAAREWLEEHRAALTRARDAFHAIGVSLEGELAQSLLSRIEAARAALQAAELGVANASHDSIERALLDFERAKIDGRDVERDIARAAAVLQIPQIPPLATLLEKAEGETRALEAQPAKRPTARQVHAAIEQGLTADPAVAKLFVIFETEADHALLQFRARAVAGS